MARSDDPWLIYGATGYTGRLVAERAVAAGLRPTLAGRNAVAVARLAAELSLDGIAFDLAHPDEVRAAIGPSGVVANCAGPFALTSAPLVDACLATGAHYLDITGELPVFTAVLSRHDEAVAAGVTLLTGGGFDVVPTDCLAGLLHAALPGAVALELAFRAPGGASRGTSTTGLSIVAAGGLRRVGGELRPTPFGSPSRRVPFPSGERWAGAVPWGDLVTAYHSTGIADITVYTPQAPRGLARRLAPVAGLILRLPPARALAAKAIRGRQPGPSEATRAATGIEVWGEVRDAAGNHRSASLTGPNAYDLTVDAVLAAVPRLLAGEVPAGAHTPATALGADFVGTLPGVTVTPP
jgi:saccharopine dehydrogenase (NAD+, L-lysine-forming)